MTCRLILSKNPGGGGARDVFRETTWPHSRHEDLDLNNLVGAYQASWAHVEARTDDCLVAAFAGKNFDGDSMIMRDTSLHENRRDPGCNNIYKCDYGLSGRSWNDSIASVIVKKIPSANSNQFQYHIKAPSQKTNGGRNPENIGTSQILDFDGTKYTPCPGGTGYFNSRTGVRCIYSKTDANGLKTLYHTTKKSNQADMLTDVTTEFCKIPDNAFKNPGGGTCFETVAGIAIAKEFCSVGDRIVSSPSCNEKNLSKENYAALAEAYCKTTAGKANTFCECFNVTSGVCDRDSTAAGCVKKRQVFDKLVESTPKDQRHLWSGREGCFGLVCQGSNKYIPANANQNCNSAINICNQPMDLSQIRESTIKASCTINSGSPPSVSTPSVGGGGGTQPPPSSTSTSGGGDDADDADADADATKESEDTNNTMIYIGIAVFAVLVLVLLLSGGGGGGNYNNYNNY